MSEFTCTPRKQRVQGIDIEAFNTHAYTHTHIHTHTLTLIHKLTHTSTHSHTQTHVSTRTHKRTYARTHERARAHDMLTYRCVTVNKRYVKGSLLITYRPGYPTAIRGD